MKAATVRRSPNRRSRPVRAERTLCRVRNLRIVGARIPTQRGHASGLLCMPDIVHISVAVGTFGPLDARCAHGYPAPYHARSVFGLRCLWRRLTLATISTLFHHVGNHISTRAAYVTSLCKRMPAARAAPGVVVSHGHDASPPPYAIPTRVPPGRPCPKGRSLRQEGPCCAHPPSWGVPYAWFPPRSLPPKAPRDPARCSG